MGLEFKQLAWPLPVHTLTSSPASFQETPYSGPGSASLLGVAEVTHIQRSVSPPLMSRLSLLLPGAWPEPVCNPLLEARAAPPPGRRRQTHTSRPCPRALLFRAAEQIAAAQAARARRGERREARALARRRAWQLSPARETSRRVRRSKAAGELLHVCLRAQRAPASGSRPGGPPTHSRRGGAKQSVNPRGEGPPRGARRASSRRLASRHGGRGGRRQSCTGKHEAVGEFPGMAIILGSERRGEQTAADLERF